MSFAKPKLLVLGSTFPARPNDGVPGFVEDLAFEEAEQFEVTVLTPMVKGAKQTETLTRGDHTIKVLRYRYFFKRFEDLADGAILDNLKAKKSRYLQVLPLMVALAVRVFRLASDENTRPNVIHAHWVIPQGLVASIVAPKVPLLVTTHGGDIYALNFAPLLAVKKWVFARAKQISTVNSEMKSKLMSFGLDSKKVHVLPMGVDTRVATQAASQVSKKKGQLLVVGRLVEKKGIEYLLQAIASAKIKDRVQLLVIGDGPIRAELEAKASGLPVTFLGQRGRDEVFSAIAESEVMVIPSITAANGDQEGLPVTLLEAGAGGICVIATNLPGINEVVADGVSGLLIEQRDVEALVAALDKVLSNGNLRKQFEAELAKSVERYDIRNVGRAYSEVLKQCI